MPLLNYTTSVPVNRTVAEMQTILAKAGAQRVSVLYGPTTANTPAPRGMMFTIDTPAGLRDFHLPVDVEAVRAALVKHRARSSRVDDRPEQAARVAWRIVKDWCEAQVALIEAQMATLDEVMLPYLVVAPNATLREQWRDHAALPAGEPS